jgi:hypothetical protein
VDEDGGVGGILQLLSLVFLIDYFDDELLTHLFMAISKEIITVEALDILTLAGDLG